MGGMPSFSEDPTEVPSDSEAKDLLNIPVFIASGFSDEGLGVPRLVDGVGQECGPFDSITGWKDGPAGSNWEEVLVIA